MKRKCIWALAAAIIGGSGIVHAQCISGDSCTAFYLEGANVAGGVISGTVTIDTTQGLFTSEDLYVAGGVFGNELFAGPLTNISVNNAPNGAVNAFIAGNVGVPSYLIDELLFVVHANSLVGYTGGTLCSTQTPCGTNSGIDNGYAITSGLLKAPEIDPDSAAAGLALLFGGVAVLCGRKQRSISA